VGADLERAERLFEEGLDWLRAHYGAYVFFAERDIVWTLQLRLLELAEQGGGGLAVYNDYPMVSRTRADLALLTDRGEVLVAAEFKYEPSHHRTDITQAKFPVVFWDSEGVGKDVRRAHEFVAAGRTQAAYAVFIDEGGAFRHRPAHPGSSWIDWETQGPDWLATSILWTKVTNAAVPAPRHMPRAG
jgi:hypothetical protein